MAMTASTAQGRVLKFESLALGSDTLRPLSFFGKEEISRPYSFQVLLLSQNREIDSAAALDNAAWFGIKQGIYLSGGSGRGVQTLCVHGVLELFEQLESRDSWFVYRAVLVPRLQRLALNVRSAVYLDKNVPEIVASVLEGAGLTTDDYEFQTNARTYPTREFVVQYQESDLDFLSRLLEHEGIFYFFQQGDGAEKVIFADSRDSFAPILGDQNLVYRPSTIAEAPSSWYEAERILSFTLRHRATPKEVVLKDFNYRTPSVDLGVTAETEAVGFGTVYEYGDHFKDTTEGAVLAQIRAEELKCRERVFDGQGDGRSFRAGATFQLMYHYREDFNAEYLITEVTHRGEQPPPFGMTGPSQASYRNNFRCIPADQVFRPRRSTLKPRLPGAINAKIDAAGDGQYAELDDQGRYKVQIPFDLSGRSGGTATRWMRMAQPYAGAGMGMHFPLHKGTEVVLAFTNGDPDRPFIASAVPNPETASPVVDKNQTQCLLKSAANNAILFEDNEAAERVLLRAQKNHEIRVENDVYERIAHDRHLLVAHDRIEHVQNDHHEKIDRDHVLEIGGSRHVTLTANDTVDIGGLVSLTVEKDVTHVFLANHTESVTGDCFLKADRIVLEAPSGITLVCGGSSVVIDSSGVTVTGSTVTIDGGQTKINSGAGSAPATVGAGSAATPIAALDPLEPGDLETSAAPAAGSGSAEAALSSTEMDWIGIELKNDKGEPVADELYQITFPDGTILRGRLDKEGKAHVEGIPSGEGEITFPRIDKGGFSKG